ncbi:unnamed protein product [Amoebophrya sp. A120]|nr:unnamed protein product [Amoebophrya sp. A120]|eukprot:GSA120T00008563001.1
MSTRLVYSPRTSKEAMVLVDHSTTVIPEDDLPEPMDQRRQALQNYIVSEKKGKRVISRILIASNGLAAVKAIRSMRRWEVLEVLKTRANLDRCLSFVAMATPEDIAANAQFLQMVDSFVEVPGGKNLNNYANVDLICKVAVQEKCDAVWPGWGHASEKPELPEALEKLGIVFLGPQPRVMRLLGDKIYANIMAQTAEVPCIPWSGDGLKSKQLKTFDDLDELFEKACCQTVEEAVEQANRIGYPVMLKASEGGGGKGIRKCENSQDVKNNYALCQMEVVNSPIFIMKYSSGACHLEVQLLGDEHGNVCALSGRDCSTQRRFQKIFEEGPPTVADPDVFHEMQLAACRLARQVGYRGAGTVEYLYDPKRKEAYFLELNPRLQVEHPVTECITGVNIPAAQLQIGMGVALHDIPDIRRYFLRGIEEQNKDGGQGETTSNYIKELDFTRKVPMYSHCIAARITAENPEDGFLPCSGNIRKIDFAPTHESVWGYFSVATPGAVHEFADSQFGHIFSIGQTREQARKALIISLGHLHVEGDIRNTVDVLPKLLRLNRFVDNQVDTAWLDGLIQNKEIARLVQTIPGMLTATSSLNEDFYGKDSCAYSDDGRVSSVAWGDSVDTQSVNNLQQPGASPRASGGTNLQQASNSRLVQYAKTKSRQNQLVNAAGQNQFDSLSQILNCEDFILYCAVAKALQMSKEAQEQFQDTLQKGQLVHSFLQTYSFPEVIVVWDQVKYTFHITRIAEHRYCCRCKDDNSECIIQTKPHQNAVFIRAICGKIVTPSTKIVSTSELTGMRLRIGAMSGYEVFIPNATDPSELRSDVQGRLIRFLVAEGDEIAEGQVCCELEAMKMIVPVKARFAGKVEKLIGTSNAVVGAGDLLLKMELAGQGPAVTIKKWSEISEGRKLFATGEDVPTFQDAAAVLQGYPRYGKLRLPETVEEGLQLLQDFLKTERYFLPMTSQSGQINQVLNISNEQVLHQMIRDDNPDLTIDKIYKIFFAKSQLHSRLSVALEILQKFDSKLLILGKQTIQSFAENLSERYGELGLKCTRLLRENARTYVNLNTVQQGKEWIEDISSAGSTSYVRSGSNSGRNSLGAGGINADTANLTSAPQSKTLMNLIHLLSPPKVVHLDPILGSAVQGAAGSSFGGFLGVQTNFEREKLRSQALELLIYRTFRGYEGLQVGPELDYLEYPNANLMFPTTTTSTMNSPLGGGGGGGSSRGGDRDNNSPLLDHRTLSNDTASNSGVSLNQYNNTLGTVSAHQQQYNSSSMHQTQKVFTSARGWKFRFPGVGNSFSGFGSFIPACNGLVVVVQSVSEMKKLLKPQYLSELAQMSIQQAAIGGSSSTGNINSNSTNQIPQRTSSHLRASPSMSNFVADQYSLETAPLPVLHDLWILYASERCESMNGTTQEIAEMLLTELNNKGSQLTGSEYVELHRISLTWTGGGAYESYQFLNRQSLGRNLPATSGATATTAAVVPQQTGISPIQQQPQFYFFAEDVLVRNLRPTFGHLLEITDQLRNNIPQRIGPEISAHCMALLNKNYLEIRAVSYDNYRGTGQQLSGQLQLPLTDETEFFLPVEIPLTHALDELARARMDKRVTMSSGNQQIPAKIFINVMTRLAFSPSVVMRGYEASILSSLSGFVKALLKYRVDTVEFKLRLVSGENLRMVASSEAEYLQPKAYLEYLNPLTGEVTRSVDLAHLVSGMMNAPNLNADENQSSQKSLEQAISKKRTVAHQAGSTYVYDFPHLLKMALLNMTKGYNSTSAAQLNAGDHRGGTTSVGATDIINSGVGSFTVIEIIADEEYKKLKQGINSQTGTGAIASSPTFSSVAGGGGNAATAISQDAQNLLSRNLLAQAIPRRSSSHQAAVHVLNSNSNDPSPAETLSPPAFGAGAGLNSTSSSFQDDTTTPIRDLLKKHQLHPTNRPIANNEIGMICWIAHLKTQEFPDGRFIVLVANDITHKAGSFGVKEDLMYKQAAEFARKTGLPFVYIASNSGARVGMVDNLENSVKPHFTVTPSAETSHHHLPSGFEYWWLDEEGYEKHKNDVVVEKIVEQDSTTKTEITKYKINAIIGGSGIGVENLKGSAMIAGETSRAYQETFTLSYVTGRSVGIGAYVNRLSSRIIQQRHGPMILTGFSALNKLLGRQVYTSQDQLGGPQVMCPNGVTHLLVENDQEGCERILEWLSFVPKRQGGSLPVLPVGFSSDTSRPGSGAGGSKPVLQKMNQNFVAATSGTTSTTDSSDLNLNKQLLSQQTGTAAQLSTNNGQVTEQETVDRFVTFQPSSPNTTYDPRFLLQGTPDNDFTGFLDQNSFVEVLSQWGKTVVVGRGRLGGIPIGCIAVETRAVSRYVPADPANLDSAVVEDSQAGQVWFPDSAYKTASAIKDFNRENLPLMIFANWRGFSGGTRDMFMEILKYGAQIVDALVEYENPVFVYLPPHAELRGGAWVVIDPSINPDFMEMYADNSSRGGILEPAGAIDVKLRPPTLIKMMNRCDSILNGKKLEQDQHNRRQELLLPLYQSMALHYADLHDRAARMKNVGCVRDVVEWKTSRVYFYWRIKRRLIECDLWRRIGNVLAVDASGGGFVSTTSPSVGSSSATTSMGSSRKVSENVKRHCEKILLQVAKIDNETTSDRSFCILFEQKEHEVQQAILAMKQEQIGVKVTQLLQSLSVEEAQAVLKEVQNRF